MTGDTSLRNRLIVALLVVWIVVALGRVLFVRWDSYNAYKHLLKGEVSNWRDLTKGRKPSLGVPGAAITVIEFSDYQCPYCGELETVLQAFAAKHQGEVAIYRINLPLEEIHPYARAAAVAAECASAQGVVEPYQERLFDHQRNFAKTDWIELAKSAGVRNLKGFRKCVEDSQPSNQIDQDLKSAKDLHISSTPTLIVNGNRLAEGVDGSDLEEIYRHMISK